LIQLDLGAAATSADEELWPGDPAEDSGDLEKWGTQAPRFLHSAPGRIRTCDTRFRKPVLYPLSYGGAVSKCSERAGARTSRGS
jgi:hypothetical protein